MKHHRVDLNRNVWKTIPYGIPIGSKASRLVSATGKISESVLGYAEHLAMNRFAGRSVSKFRGSFYTERGNLMEQAAADWYDNYQGVKSETCGFFTDDALAYGASPDRIVGDDGLVEIKCQGSAGHLKTLAKLEKIGNSPLQYYPQIQMELMASERLWLDVVLYHPEHHSTVLRIFPDLEFHERLKLQIDVCIKHRDLVFNKLIEGPIWKSGLTMKQLTLLEHAINKGIQSNEL